jgi:hypothetical protein
LDPDWGVPLTTLLVASLEIFKMLFKTFVTRFSINFQHSSSTERQQHLFDMNVPGFIGDIFNGIDFSKFLDSLPQRFPVANFRQNALRLWHSTSRRIGQPWRFLYNIFYQNWVEETLFVFDLSRS